MFILLDLEHLVQNGNQKFKSKESTLLHLDWLYEPAIVKFISFKEPPAIFRRRSSKPPGVVYYSVDTLWTSLAGLIIELSIPAAGDKKTTFRRFFIWKRWEICLKVRVFWVVEPHNRLIFFGQVYWGLYTTIDNLPAVSAVAISFWSLPQFGILAETPFCSCLSMSFFGPGYEYTSSHFELWWHSDTCQVLAGLILRIPHSRWSSRRSNQKEIQRHKIFRKPSSTWMLGFWRTAKELAPGGIETKRNRWELPTGTGRSATITLLDVAGLWERKGWPGSCSTVFVLKESTHVWRICFLDISILDFCKVRNWSFHLPDFF